MDFKFSLNEQETDLLDQVFIMAIVYSGKVAIEWAKSGKNDMELFQEGKIERIKNLQQKIIHALEFAKGS